MKDLDRFIGIGIEALFFEVYLVDLLILFVDWGKFRFLYGN